MVLAVERMRVQVVLAQSVLAAQRHSLMLPEHLMRALVQLMRVEDP